MLRPPYPSLPSFLTTMHSAATRDQRRARHGLTIQSNTSRGTVSALHENHSIRKSTWRTPLSLSINESKRPKNHAPSNHVINVINVTTILKAKRLGRSPRTGSRGPWSVVRGQWSVVSGPGKHSRRNSAASSSAAPTAEEEEASQSGNTGGPWLAHHTALPGDMRPHTGELLWCRILWAPVRLEHT